MCLFSDKWRICDVTNALNPKSWGYTLFKAVYRLSFFFFFKASKKETRKRKREIKRLFRPHLLRNVKFIHHSELIVHLYSTFHQLQFRQGQVTEVEFINFIFLCIWQLFLLCETWSQVTGTHEGFLGPSPIPPTQALSLSRVRWKDQSRVERVILGRDTPRPCLGHTLCL